MIKYYEINESGCSVRCKVCCEEPRAVRRAVIFGHGFGGHKDNRAAERFAEKYLAKKKGSAVVMFDWPCHGTDGRKKLLLGDCAEYLGLVIADTKRRYQTDKLYAYATSFGAFLFLRYIADHGDPFRRIALRCPALPMHEVITKTIMTAEDLEKLEAGKPALVGFDRKIRIDREFLEALREADVTKLDYLDEAEKILIIHGTKDEIVPIGAVRKFADDNLIEFIEAENADHRFQDPKIMDLAIAEIIKFFEA